MEANINNNALEYTTESILNELRHNFISIIFKAVIFVLPDSKFKKGLIISIANQKKNSKNSSSFLKKRVRVYFHVTQK